MNVVYMVELNKPIPNRYIGSKMHCELKGGNLVTARNRIYWGSSSDKSYQEIIENNEIGKRIVILEEIHSDSAYDVLTAEKEWQKRYDVVASPQFYNKSIATVNNYSDPLYATYKNLATGKRARLPRNHPDVLSGLWVGVTKGNRMPKAWIEELSKRVTGEGNPFFGHKHSEKSLSLMKEHSAHRPMTPEFIEWFKEHVAKVRRTERWKANIGRAHIKKNTVINPSTGEMKFCSTLEPAPEGFISFQKYVASKSKAFTCVSCNRESFAPSNSSPRFCSECKKNKLDYRYNKLHPEEKRKYEDHKH